MADGVAGESLRGTESAEPDHGQDAEDDAHVLGHVRKYTKMYRMSIGKFEVDQGILCTVSHSVSLFQTEC